MRARSKRAIRPGQPSSQRAGGQLIGLPKPHVPNRLDSLTRQQVSQPAGRPASERATEFVNSFSVSLTYDLPCPSVSGRARSQTAPCCAPRVRYPLNLEFAVRTRYLNFCVPNSSLSESTVRSARQTQRRSALSPHGCPPVFEFESCNRIA